MCIAEKVISAPCDFNSRFVANFVQSVVGIKSTPYIATIERNVNAKSILGLLSADIKQGNDICIQTVDNYNQEQADKDLEYIIGLICERN